MLRRDDLAGRIGREEAGDGSRAAPWMCLRLAPWAGPALSILGLASAQRNIAAAMVVSCPC